MKTKQRDLLNHDLHGQAGEGLTPAGLPLQTALTGGQTWNCCKMGVCNSVESDGYPFGQIGYACFAEDPAQPTPYAELNSLSNLSWRTW